MGESTVTSWIDEDGTSHIAIINRRNGHVYSTTDCGIADILDILPDGLQGGVPHDCGWCLGGLCVYCEDSIHGDGSAGILPHDVKDCRNQIDDRVARHLDALYEECGMMLQKYIVAKSVERVLSKSGNDAEQS